MSLPDDLKAAAAPLLAIDPAAPVIGFPHGKGELVVIAGPRGRGKANTIQKLQDQLPPGSRFAVHEWPFHCHKFDIERDLKDGLYVFVDANDDLDRFPVKPFRLVRTVEDKAAALKS